MLVRFDFMLAGFAGDAAERFSGPQRLTPRVSAQCPAKSWSAIGMPNHPNLKVPTEPNPGVPIQSPTQHFSRLVQKSMEVF